LRSQPAYWALLVASLGFGWLVYWLTPIGSPSISVAFLGILLAANIVPLVLIIRLRLSHATDSHRLSSNRRELEIRAIILASLGGVTFGMTFAYRLLQFDPIYLTIVSYVLTSLVVLDVVKRKRTRRSNAVSLG